MSRIEKMQGVKFVFGLLLIVSLASCVNNEKAQPANQDGNDQYPEAPVDTAAGSNLNTETAPSDIVNRANYHTVEIKQMKFVPAELVVNQGDTVVWINNDITTHDVTEQPSGAWTSSAILSGKSWSMVVRKSTDYYCSIHVVMKGKLIVQN
jgi:plastocyanin